MKIIQIATHRKFDFWPSNDLVYEWEDVFCPTSSLSLYHLFKYYRNSYLAKIPFAHCFLGPFNNTFVFEMAPMIHQKRLLNRANVVPCIIDFYLRDSQLDRFVENYTKNPMVCLSSKEAYDHVAANPSVSSRLRLCHLPLSISDKYAIGEDTCFDKLYDLVMMGRQNPVLLGFVKTYADRHKDFTYVYREMDKKTSSFNYYTNRGEALGNINTREQYFELMRKGRCGLYGTPGIDGGESRTHGFSQVTPRFLELIASGCHVIARYRGNSDTDYYELERFSPSVETYEEFEQMMDKARATEVDMAFYSTYLKKHYTSVRAKQMEAITKDL